MDFIFQFLKNDFKLDNNSVGPQPKREVSIFGLNDNIDHAFLSDMCK